MVETFICEEERSLCPAWTLVRMRTFGLVRLQLGDIFAQAQEELTSCTTCPYKFMLPNAALFKQFVEVGGLPTIVDFSDEA